jgi:uncharacterized protein
MLLVSTSVKPSPIHGLGCFTNERIRRGQVVWEFDPRVDVPIRMDELSALPPVVQEVFHALGYVEMRGGARTVILCADHGRHVNHSDRPNLIDGGPNTDTQIAARDIEIGEELTCDYWSFDLDAERKLGRRKQARPPVLAHHPPG